MLTKTEAKLIVQFLDELSERFGNDGCNDFTLDDTPENRAFVEAAQEGQDLELSIDKKQMLIYTFNTLIVDHLIARVKEEFPED